MKDRIIQEFMTRIRHKVNSDNANLTICIDDGYSVIEERGDCPRKIIADYDTLQELINFAFAGKFDDHNEVINQLETEIKSLKNNLKQANEEIEMLHKAYTS